MDPHLEESEDSDYEIPSKIINAGQVKKRKRVMDPNLEQSEIVI